MMQERAHMTCKTFDESIRILIWTMDEFLILIPMGLLGVFMRSLILIGLAITLKVIYTQIKKKNRYQRLSHLLYRYFPTDICQRFGYFEGLPPSHLKEVLLT